jgi:SAM-dependent methyltransferase
MMPEFNQPTTSKHQNLPPAFFENDDKSFDALYPANIRILAAKHWSPLNVALCAAKFLAPEKNVHVLDIGSGVGKFCIAAARLNPDAMFYGVEQRKDLVEHAIDCSEKIGLPNVCFIHGNFTELDLKQFDHFYFFNSFYENLEGTDKIDDKLEYSLSLYNYYTRYLFTQLERKPKHTRIATFHSLEGEIPPSYYTVKDQFDGSLKFWIKA